MRWLDTAEDALVASRERGATPIRLYDRKVWASMSPTLRQAAGAHGSGAAVRGVRYRLDAAPWLILARRGLEDHADSWALWDTRTAPPSPLVVGIPDETLARRLGVVAAQSRALRLVLGAGMVAAATCAALVALWRRERTG